MEIEFTRSKDTLPKKVNRSKRLRKKMHVDEFTETLFRIAFPVRLFDDVKSDVEDALLDVIYEHDNGVTIIGDNDGFVIFTVFSEINNPTEFINEYISTLLDKLSTVSTEYKEIKSIAVTYGDANYGE